MPETKIEWKAHNLKAAGSNPAPATNPPTHLPDSGFVTTNSRLV